MREKLTIEIETVNAAFEDIHEIGRVLLDVARFVVDRGQTEGKVYDVNGNAVGRFEWK